MPENESVYSVTIIDILGVEPEVEFTEYGNAVHYAELLMGKHCPSNQAARAQITDNMGGTHWSLSCAEWRLLTSKRRADTGNVKKSR